LWLPSVRSWMSSRLSWSGFQSWGGIRASWTIQAHSALVAVEWDTLLFFAALFVVTPTPYTPHPAPYTSWPEPYA
jgi:hypothetical protein